jgi:hypothetical protein
MHQQNKSKTQSIGGSAWSGRAAELRSNDSSATFKFCKVNRGDFPADLNAGVNHEE